MSIALKTHWKLSACPVEEPSPLAEAFSGAAFQADSTESSGWERGRTPTNDALLLPPSMAPFPHKQFGGHGAKPVIRGSPCRLTPGPVYFSGKSAGLNIPAGRHYGRPARPILHPRPRLSEPPAYDGAIVEFLLNRSSHLPNQTPNTAIAINVLVRNAMIIKGEGHVKLGEIVSGSGEGLSLPSKLVPLFQSFIMSRLVSWCAHRKSPSWRRGR